MAIRVQLKQKTTQRVPLKAKPFVRVQLKPKKGRVVLRARLSIMQVAKMLYLNPWNVNHWRFSTSRRPGLEITKNSIVTGAEREPVGIPYTARNALPFPAAFDTIYYDEEAMLAWFDEHLSHTNISWYYLRAKAGKRIPINWFDIEANRNE